MYIFMFLGMLFLCYILNSYLRVKNELIFRRFLEANNLFCIQYLLWSVCFIVLEDFAVWKPLVCMGVVDALIIFVLILKKAEWKKTYFKIEKSEWIVLIVTIFSASHSFI